MVIRIQMDHPLRIKHGLLENNPLIDGFRSKVMDEVWVAQLEVFTPMKNIYNPQTTRLNHDPTCCGSTMVNRVSDGIHW